MSSAHFQPTPAPTFRFLWWLPRLAFLTFVATVIALLWFLEKSEQEDQRATMISDMLWLEQNLRFLLDHNEELLGRFDPVRIDLPDIFEAHVRPLIGSNTGISQVIWLDKTRPAQALTQQLRLRHYLRSYGATLAEGLERPQPNAGWQTLVDDLVLNVGSLSEPIGQLNYLAQQARGNLRVQLTDRQIDSRSLEALLRKFEQAQLLQVKGNTLHFASEAARAFANGGWIEHHVYQIVCQVTGPLAIRDKAANLQVQDISGQPNEMDVAFLARNRLFVIECKTARMDNPEDLKANDTLYKLVENCRRIGGLGTRGMLATYRPLRESELRLANALQIEVVAGASLARLDEKLKHWVNPRT